MAICRGILKPINTKEADSGLDEEPLSPGARISHAPGLNCFIVGAFGFKTRTDVEAMKNGLKNTLVKHPRFSSKLVFHAKKTTKPVGWVRTEVNMDDHIITPDLDPNMDSPDQFLEDYISNISKTPLNMIKPLWELHILNVKTSRAASTIVFRVHHSLGDGVSLTSLVFACTRKSSDPHALPSFPMDKNKKKKPQTRNDHHWLIRCLFSWLMMFKVLWNTLVGVVLFLATIVCLKDSPNPLKGSPGIERKRRRFVHKIFNFDDIKFLKNAMGMTVNDVLLGMTQAGISRYLNTKYGKDTRDYRNCKDNKLNHIRLRAALTMNLRPNLMIKDLAEKMKADSKGGWQWGNLFGAVILPLHIAPKEDPLDYFYTAKATVDQKKQSFEVWLTFFATRFLYYTLGLKVASTLVYRALSNTTLTFSSVVGPMEEVSLCGHPLVFFAPTVYGVPQALTVHFQSYTDKMILTLGVDDDVIRDPLKLCDEMEESLKLAKNSIIERDGLDQDECNC